jgi:hypothetical protein
MKKLKLFGRNVNRKIEFSELDEQNTLIEISNKYYQHLGFSKNIHLDDKQLRKIREWINVKLGDVSNNERTV